MSTAEKIYGVIYGKLIPRLYRYRRRAGERIPFSLSMTYLINKLLRRDIERDLLNWEFYLKDKLVVDKDCKVLDVGANIGQWTLWFAQRIGPKGVVVALEPDPEAYFWLRRNTLRMENVVSLKVAAWSENTTLELRTSRVSFMSSVADRRASSHGIRALTLDTIATSLGLIVDLIKMDVEGAEQAVLAGSTRVLSTCKKLLVEVHHPEEISRLMNSLNEAGFSVEVFRERWLFATKTD